MKKVLIFWSGKQGKKYIKYFSQFKLKIDIVNKTWILKGNEIKNIYLFDDLVKNALLNLNTFDLIVVAVFPYNEQTKVVKYLIENNIDTKIIIEKPITNDYLLLDKLYKNENITFFIDEVYFSRLFIWKKITEFKIKVDISNTEILEHALWFFLLNVNFKNILSNLEIENKINNKDELIYEILINNYHIICNNWYFINKKRISLWWIFNDSLPYVLSFLENKKLNDLYKKNIILMYKNLEWIIKE